MRKISKYKVNNYLSGYWEQISKSEPTCKAYQLGIAQGMFNFYQYLKEMEGQEFANKTFKSLTDGKEEYHSILKTLIVLENESSEKIDHIMELFSNQKKDVPISESEIEVLSAITRYFYERNK